MRAACRRSPPLTAPTCLGHRLRARTGPLLRDGSVAPPGRRRARGTGRQGGAGAGPARAPVSLPRPGARGTGAGQLPSSARLFAAYTRGVNAGLAALRSRPWEYWVLAQPPAAWRDEDGLLVVLCHVVGPAGERPGAGHPAPRRQCAPRRPGVRRGAGSARCISSIRAAPAGMPLTCPRPETPAAAPPPVPADRCAQRARARRHWQRVELRPATPAAGKQQLGGGRPPDRERRGARRQRHAPQPARAHDLVPRATADRRAGQPTRSISTA